jgi:hypothetical protein
VAKALIVDDPPLRCQGTLTRQGAVLMRTTEMVKSAWRGLLHRLYAMKYAPRNALALGLTVAAIFCLSGAIVASFGTGQSDSSAPLPKTLKSSVLECGAPSKGGQRAIEEFDQCVDTAFSNAPSSDPNSRKGWTVVMEGLLALSIGTVAAAVSADKVKLDQGAPKSLTGAAHHSYKLGLERSRGALIVILLIILSAAVTAVAAPVTGSGIFWIGTIVSIGAAVIDRLFERSSLETVTWLDKLVSRGMDWAGNARDNRKQPGTHKTRSK